MLLVAVLTSTIVYKSKYGMLVVIITRIARSTTMIAVFNRLRLRHATLRHDIKNRSTEAKQIHVREPIVPMYEKKRRLLHQSMLVDDASILKPMDNTRGRRPNNNAIIFKNEEMNNKNEHGVLRLENKMQTFTKFPTIPKPKIGKPA